MSADIETLLFPTSLSEASALPLRVQIRERVLAAIGAGLLKPEDRLPTMRALAVHLRVDLNTVQRAYAELERLGAIRTLRARGSFVSDTPPHPDGALKAAEARALAASTIARSQAAGLDPEAVVIAMRDLLGLPPTSSEPESGSAKG
ncbi:GntR family transcriptional regulator [Gluconobacter cerevisiae]|uniref:GntR family transcriptional regulator n=1 Tax=Gluconobacter cerevisiae TaxID=1379734 RepID=A0ABR9YEK8_9PROT|nr:GntR family transcriptional regulator [Gluconobacter cerevisiae]MBF0877103.1 GntR family transcriptional regulator [Gluconobacter cerevisiae]